MSSLQFFSSCSGMPLFSFSTDSKCDSQYDFQVGSLNGTLLFSTFRSGIFLYECGNGIIEVFWKSDVSFNIIFCCCEPSSYYHFTMLISFYEDLLSLFTPHLYVASFDSFTKNSFRSNIKYSNIFRSVISSCDFPLGCSVFNNIPIFSDLLKNHQTIFVDIYACFTYQDLVIHRTDNWISLNNRVHLLVLNIVETLKPFSIIDLPIYIHTLMSEPLRLFSMQVTHSLVFIGLFGSDLQFEEIVFPLRKIRNNIRLINESVYLTPSFSQACNLCIALLRVNSITNEYLFTQFPKNIVFDRKIVKSLLFRRYISFFSYVIKFREYSSQFDNCEMLSLEIGEHISVYQNFSLYIDRSQNLTNIFLFPRCSLNIFRPFIVMLAESLTSDSSFFNIS